MSCTCLTGKDLSEGSRLKRESTFEKEFIFFSECVKHLLKCGNLLQRISKNIQLNH